MLLDWITARIPAEHIGAETMAELLRRADIITRYSVRGFDEQTGKEDRVYQWKTTAWDSVRSDSHQVVFRVTGSFIYVQGSPGRAIGDGCAVFGSGACASLDTYGALLPMLYIVEKQLDLILPKKAELWEVRRVDVTQNLLLDSLADVREALRVLRNCEGGRYRVNQQHGDTVYWSTKSTLRSGKAYAKGPHLEYLSRRGDYGRVYSTNELEASKRLLRLELKLGRHWFDRNEKKWWQLTANDLKQEWNSYFARMIGDADMKKDDDLKERIAMVAPSEGYGRAAYGTWLLIQAEGWERAKEGVGRSSWYVHMRILRAAGLGDADISAGEIVPLRRKVLEARPVTSWQELLAA